MGVALQPNLWVHQSMIPAEAGVHTKVHSASPAPASPLLAANCAVPLPPLPILPAGKVSLL